jgi:hypothetical protein
VTACGGRSSLAIGSITDDESGVAPSPCGGASTPHPAVLSVVNANKSEQRFIE